MNFGSPKFNKQKEGNRLSTKLIFGRTVVFFCFYRIESNQIVNRVIKNDELIMTVLQPNLPTGENRISYPILETDIRKIVC